MTLEEIREAPLQLPQDVCELLGTALLTSLGTTENQTDIDAAWVREIQARSEAHQSGRVIAVDAGGTVERIRQRLALRAGT